MEDVESISDRVNEPALVLTPPQKANKEDDGLLTASEIELLNIDAEWVVLSACNTAGAEKDSREVFSGLARAFVIAGAPSLLVSHWKVDSAASEQLITNLFRELSTADISRAEALRRAMKALIRSDDSLANHPMYWSPFVLVGTGP